MFYALADSKTVVIITLLSYGTETPAVCSFVLFHFIFHRTQLYFVTKLVAMVTPLYPLHMGVSQLNVLIIKILAQETNKKTKPNHLVTYTRFTNRQTTDDILWQQANTAMITATLGWKCKYSTVRNKAIENSAIRWKDVSFNMLTTACLVYSLLYFTVSSMLSHALYHWKNYHCMHPVSPQQSHHSVPVGCPDSDTAITTNNDDWHSNM